MSRGRRATPQGGPLRTTSLRTRVTVLVVLVLAVALAGTAFAVDALFSVQTNSSLTGVLADRTQEAISLAKRGTRPDLLKNLVDVDNVRARLVTPTGRIYGSLPTPTSNKPALDQRTIVLTSPNPNLNGARLTMVVVSSTIVTAQAQLRRLLLLVGLIALAVATVALVFTVRFALSPLHTMTELARSIARGYRGRRLSPTKPATELGRTAQAFDEMLDALEGAELQARVAEAASRASEERTKRFVADAAHELRTPIAGVQAAAEAVLQQRPDADPEERDRLTLLLIRESRRAGQLINDLLDLARIDAGVELNRAPVDLRQLVDAQAERIRLLAPELTVVVDGPSVTVPVDEKRITQIVANLLDNARHATSSGGRVGVVLRRVGTFAEVLVSDSGYGVAPEDRERIFDRLVRLDIARDRRSGGSGLGLPIARGFARAHGGELSCVEPPPGQTGAVFRLVLPLADDPAAQTARISTADLRQPLP